MRFFLIGSGFTSSLLLAGRDHGPEVWHCSQGHMTGGGGGGGRFWLLAILELGKSSLRGEDGKEFAELPKSFGCVR